MTVACNARPTGGREAHAEAPVRRPAGAMRIDCQAPGQPISPMIYGVATSPRFDSPIVDLGAPAARWGGNTSSRYNWKLGNAWNAGSDWFFRNTNYAGSPKFTFMKVLDFHREHNIKTALTIPMIGWVAKDTESMSFPVSVFGVQQRTDNRGAGNGKTPDGKDIAPGSPSRTRA